MLLYMFRASQRSSSGGHCIHAVSGFLMLCMLPYVAQINLCHVWQHTEREKTGYCIYTMSSWGWALWRSKHVEEHDMMLLLNKETCASSWLKNLYSIIFQVVIICVSKINKLPVKHYLYINNYIFPLLRTALVRLCKKISIYKNAYCVSKFYLLYSLILACL
jgi:hypothetical protein